MSDRAMLGLPPPRPIPIRERSSILFVEKGRHDVLGGAFVLVDHKGVRMHIPIGGLACLLLGRARGLATWPWYWLHALAHF
jgi:CRISPR-associated protein Cas1